MRHDVLWRENADLAAACRAHPFVRSLADGTLAAAAFQRYVAQDAFFLRAFLRAYAVALARCASLDHARQFHTFIGGVLEELKLHAAYAARLGVDLEHVTPCAATSTYTDFLLHTAWHRAPGETLAAMTPCMRLYAYLGQALTPSLRPSHPYADWIRTYASPEFDGLASAVETLLDALAEDTPAVHDAYRYAMQCELDFFSAPLEPTP